LREKLEKCSFLVELILPGSTLNSRQLLGLERGSILTLRLRSREPAILCVEKQPLFIAQPVRSGNHRAAQIVKAISAADPRGSENLD
jgi:flagellar motor switch protein FliM